MNSQEMADLARQWVASLPKPLLDAIHAIYFNAVALTERYPNLTDISITEAIASLNLQSLLPPLISILTIYFALVSLYRTTAFFVRSTVFLAKWGVLVGATGLAVGYIANIVAPDTLGLLNQSTSRRRPPRPTKPRIWDTFEEHRRWRETQGEENRYGDDASRVAKGIIEKVVDATKQAAGQGGWWGTLSGLAAKTVVGDDTAHPGKGRKVKNARGKVKSR